MQVRTIKVFEQYETALGFASPEKLYYILLQPGQVLMMYPKIILK